MRKNEYNTLSEFTSQYIGEWNPAEGHWLGLDFSYHDKEYRFSTGSMYNKENTILSNGKEAIYYLYEKISFTSDYKLLGEFATMEEVLHCRLIENSLFQNIIMEDEVELLGQD